MKKIKLFSLLAATLLAGSAMAADPTYLSVPRSEVIQTTSYDALKKYYTDTTWVANGFTNGTNDKYVSIEPLLERDAIITDSKNKKRTGIKLKNQSHQKITIYVTGIEEIHAYYCGATKRWAYMDITEARNAIQIKDTLSSDANSVILSKSDLDPNEEYSV